VARQAGGHARLYYGWPHVTAATPGCSWRVPRGIAHRITASGQDRHRVMANTSCHSTAFSGISAPATAP
jgi:hypothetical protein